MSALIWILQALAVIAGVGLLAAGGLFLLGLSALETADDFYSKEGEDRG